jgi:formylglycine-generating enzyme required for sulfatase activity
VRWKLLAALASIIALWWGYLTVVRLRGDAELTPLATFRDCKQCPEMVVVPAGQFGMGTIESDPGRTRDEGRLRPVTIEHPFAVGKYEVTFAEWDACVSGGGCSHTPDDGGWGHGRQPVINVDWDDARAYASWLSRKTGKPYRLLSEAEWEYAARAGTTTRFPWGDDPGKNLANFVGSGSRWSAQRTAPVDSFSANSFGLHNMIGNVLEWVQDCYDDRPEAAYADGRPWESGDCGNRLMRGGSWYGGPENARAAARSRAGPGLRVNYVGFRVARSLSAARS